MSACGSSGNASDANGDGGSDEAGDDGPSLFGIDGGQPAGPCVGLQCKQQTCASGGTTSVSGTVFDPAGKVPLYNVIVYVPNAPLAPMPQGASCDKCGSSVSGSPIVTTLTDAAGHFKLDNVPVVDDLPLVIQLGKWRRTITVPTLKTCGDMPVVQAATRMPRNKSEGDIPQFALTTGACDPLECLLRKIGIDDAEFTGPSGAGRVHIFQGTSSPDTQLGLPGLTGGSLSGGSPPATALWSDVSTLKKYDVVLLACECNESPEEKPQAALQAMFDYTSAGGRLFGSHFHYYWLEQGPTPFPSTATWNHSLGVPADITATIDDSFPKGVAFKQWLVNVGASPAPGGSLHIGEARGDVEAVNAQMSQRWIYLPSNPASVQYFTFNTPIQVPADQQCGRVVFSDLHVAGGSQPGQPLDTAGRTFPGGCATKDLSPQEKALEFMLFDLSSCVQSDSTPPAPPPVR